jgi:outer membrane protein TolC
MHCFWLFLGLIGVSSVAQAADRLGLSNYLQQVRQGNQAYLSAVKGAEGAALRKNEGDQVYAPVLQGQALWSDDQSPKVSVPAQGVETRFQSASIGVSKAWGMGVTSRVGYLLNHTEIIGANPGFLSRPIFYDSRPSVELSVSLLRNRGGSEFAAQAALLDEQARASQAAEAFRAQMVLAQAEGAYWRCSASREVARVQAETLDRAKKMVEWNVRRVDLHLADESDLKQAQALLRLREIELQAARDELRSASRAFNSLRGVDSDLVSEGIEPLETGAAQAGAVPSRRGHRGDTEAAVSQSQAALQGSRLGQERNRPTLEVFGSATLNGQNPAGSTAWQDSLTTTYPNLSAGVRLTLPLEFGRIADQRKGYALEAAGADLRATRALFEEEVGWQDLSRRYTELKERLALVRRLEEAQKEKFLYERDRHSRGKSTVFLVLQFEQDYNSAQINRLRTEAEVLALLATLKTWPSAQTEGDAGA